MKEETRRKRELEKLDISQRAELLKNEAFQRFLRYLCTNASEIRFNSAGGWLPGWIVTGCELFFTDTVGHVKEIVKDDGGRWWLEEDVGEVSPYGEPLSSPQQAEGYPAEGK
ncbi:unnamed protein product, partial [marine sediment metagenome]